MAPSRSARPEPLPAWDAVDSSAGATTRGRKRQCTSTTSSVVVAAPQQQQQQSVHHSDDPAWFTSMLEDFHNKNPTAIINANLQNTGSSLNTNEDPADLDASTLPVMEHALAGHEIVTSSVQSEKRSTSVVGNNHGRSPLNNSVRVIMDFDELSQDQLIELVGSLQLEYNDLQDADLINTLVSGVILKGTLFTNSTESTPRAPNPSKRDRDDLAALVEALRRTFNHDGLLCSLHHVSSIIPPVQRAARFSNTVKAILLQHKHDLHYSSTAYNANALIRRASAFLPELETMISDKICSDKQKDANIKMLWPLLMWVMKRSVVAGYENNDFIWDKAGQEALKRFDKLMERIVTGKVDLAPCSLGQWLVLHRYLDTSWMDRDFEILGAVSEKAVGLNARDAFMQQTRAWMRDFLLHARDQVQRGRAHAAAGIEVPCLLPNCPICKQAVAGAFVRVRADESPARRAADDDVNGCVSDESPARRAADDDVSDGIGEEVLPANEELTTDNTDDLQVDMTDEDQVLACLAALAGRTAEEVAGHTVTELASLIATCGIDDVFGNPALSTNDLLAQQNTDSEDSAAVALAHTALCENGGAVEKDGE